MEIPENCFFFTLEDILENAEIIITALRDLTYSSKDLTMGDTADDVQELLSQIDKFRGRINSQKEKDERSKEELRQKLKETEVKLRNLKNSNEEELKESEDKLEKLRNETDVKFSELEKSKQEEIEQLQSSLNENEVNLEILRMDNESLQEKLRSSEEEVKVFRNELDLVKKEKLEAERKFEAISVEFQLVSETLRDNGIVLRVREPTPEQSKYFLLLASELAGKMEAEWDERKPLNVPPIGESLKTEASSLPLREGNDNFSEESDEEDISKTTSASTESEAPEEDDKQNEAQVEPVDNQTLANTLKSSEPSPKRSTRTKKKKVMFSPDREEPTRKTPRMEGDPPPVENEKLTSRMSNKKKGYQCKSCGKTYQNRTSLTYHEKSVHLKVRFSCQVCGYQFTSKKWWKDHRKRCRPKSGLKICQQCKRRFKTLEELKGHQKSEHSIE